MRLPAHITFPHSSHWLTVALLPTKWWPLGQVKVVQIWVVHALLVIPANRGDSVGENCGDANVGGVYGGGCEKGGGDLKGGSGENGLRVSAVATVSAALADATELGCRWLHCICVCICNDDSACCRSTANCFKSTAPPVTAA